MTGLIIKKTNKKKTTKKEIPDYFPLFERGKLRFYDSVTGREVETSKTTQNSLFEPFNPDKAAYILDSLSNGDKLSSVLQTIGITHRIYSYWQRMSPTFANRIEESKTFRANKIHEDFYENHIEPLSSPDQELDVKHLKAVELAQSIVSKHKREDSPVRYSTTYSKTHNFTEQRVDMEVTIPDNVVEMLKKNHSPKLNKEGDIYIDHSNT